MVNSNLVNYNTLYMLWAWEWQRNIYWNPTFEANLTRYGNLVSNTEYFTSLFPAEYKFYLSKYDDATYSKLRKLWIRTPFYIPDGWRFIPRPSGDNDKPKWKLSPMWTGINLWQIRLLFHWGQITFNGFQLFSCLINVKVRKVPNGCKILPSTWKLWGTDTKLWPYRWKTKLSRSD